MKKVLLSTLGCLLAISAYTQNRYSTYSTSTFTPKSDADIYRDITVKNGDLNKGIFNLLNICDEQLDNPNFCFGNFRNTVSSVKKRLNDVNRRAMNGFISIYDVENTYNSCVKDYNNALRKHKKNIDRELKRIEKQNKKRK